jgi:hypothetical protein
MAGCQECSNGPPGGINGGEVLDYHSGYSVLKKSTAQWTETVAVIRTPKAEAALASENFRSLKFVPWTTDIQKYANFFGNIFAKCRKISSTHRHGCTSLQIYGSN